MSTHGINCQMLSNPLLKQEGESRSPRDTPSGSSNYSTAGSKRAIPTSCDILSNLTVDYKLHPSGEISRDPSPMSKMTASVERDKDNKQDKNRRREIKNEKTRGKEGYIETEPGRYFEKERALDSRVKDGETGWMVRERGQDYNRSPNGGLMSNVKTETEKDMKRRRKKGDTFPRMKRGDIAPDPRLMPTPEIVEERRRRDRPKREETNYWEEKMNWILTKGKEEGKNPGRRPTEDERTQKRETYKVYGIEFQDTARDTIDLQDMRDRVAARKREDIRLDMDERKAGMYSHQRRPDRETHGRKDERRVPKTETYFDDREPRRDKMRERRGEEGYYRDKMSQERGRDRQSDRGTGVEGSRRKEEANCEKYWETDRRTTEQVDRERERWMEAKKIFSDRKGDDQNRRERRHKEIHERREDATGRNSRSMSDSAPRVPPQVESSAEWSRKGDSEKNKRDKDIYKEGDTRKKGGAERERIGEKQRDPEGAADRSQRQQTRSEKQEKDRGGGTTKSMPEQRRMWLKPQWGKNHTDEDSERYRRPKEGMREKERDVESQAEWGRDGRQVKAELDERYVGQTSSKEGLGGKNEYGGNSDGVSVDGDEIENERETVREKKGHLSDSDGGTGINQQGGVEGENVVDTTEESGTEEEGGRDYLKCSGSDGGSDAGWKQDSDRMLPEDNFGCDEEGDERDEEFKNHGCVSYEYPTASSSKSSEADEREEDWTRKKKVIDKDAQGRQKKSTNVFCVIGKSHSWSETTELSLSEDDEMGGAEKDEPNLEKLNHSSDDATLTSSRNYEQSVLSNQDKEDDHSTPRFTSGEAREDIHYITSKKLEEKELGIKSNDGLSNLKITAKKRDSQTEKLLKRWREQHDVVQKPVPSNSHAEANSQDHSELIPSLDDINTESMRPEELDNIQIGMKGAWTTSEETKRHSQAAHMKWAKNVVRLYLGNSEEQVDEQNSEPQDQGVNQSKDNREPEVVSQISFDLPTVTLTSDDRHWEPELKKDNLEEEFRGMRQANMHADQVTAMPVVTTTYTHTDTHLNAGMKEDQSTNQKTELSGHAHLENADIDELRGKDRETGREKEVEIYVSVTNTLYKPNSCPSLRHDSDSDFVPSPTEGKSQQVRDKIDQSVDERQTDRKYTEVEVGNMIGEMEEETNEEMTAASKRVLLTGTKSCSSLNLGPTAHFRRRAIRIPTKRRNGEHEKVEEEEGVGRDRRARVFSPTDDDKSKSWGGMDLRNVLDEIKRCQKNKGLYNATQLYQDYTNTTQDFEILQSLSVSVGEDHNLSPANSPPPSRRPLPPLPPLPTVLHSQSFSHTCSVTSAKNLPLPELPRSERRPSSPRLSISLTQQSLLWRDLEDVRYSPELEKLTEDQRRLQEVRFEVVTSEASYCRSLDIVVDHFVKSKQLGVLLNPQDKNWLFSRLAEVRTISRRFLSALEERMESNIMYFTVCDIIAEHCPLFRLVYVPYLTNQSYQDTTYQKLMNENPGFKQLVETLERSPICQRLPLRSFLVLPFQRITRIKLLVQNIVKRTTPGTVEATHAVKALKLLEKLIRDSNESISQMKNLESLVTLNSKVNFECRTLPLVRPSRRLVREGPVTRLSHSLKEPEKNIYLHLFNDNLLLSIPKEGGRFTVIGHYPVESLHADDCPVKLDTLQKNLFRLRILHDLLLLRADSESDKLRWISAISRPHPEFDFSADQDYEQMQCIRAYVAQQPDELSLEKADVILVQQDSDNWVEGTRLSDLHSGWVPKSHLEAIINPKVRKRNLSDALKLTTATATSV